MNSQDIISQAKSAGYHLEQGSFYPSLAAQRDSIIHACINELNRTDYITIKYLENAISDEVFDYHKQQRQSLRDEIKSLENTDTTKTKQFTPHNANNKNLYNAGIDLANELSRSCLLYTSDAADE